MKVLTSGIPSIKSLSVRVMVKQELSHVAFIYSSRTEG